MTIEQIILELNNLRIENSEDFSSLERVDELTNFIRDNEEGYKSCAAMINLLERHPSVEFGSPGEPVHTIETFAGQHEELLYESLKRQPTRMTVLMLNRVINDKVGNDRNMLVSFLKNLTEHKNADEEAKELAMEFYEYQLEKN
jgi:hypothetical protein